MSQAHEQARRLADPREWYARLYRDQLCYPYQLELLLALERAVDQAQEGRCETPELVAPWSRQTGKNETDCRWSVRALAKYGERAKRRKARTPWLQMVKSAPTYKPQIAMSKRRLRMALDAIPMTRGNWQTSEGYIYNLKGFPCFLAFLSAQEQANRVGETANLVQAIDECQDTSRDVYDKDLAPMRASTGAPVIFYGTEWTPDCLLHIKIEELRQLEQRDGKKRVFLVPWDLAAQQIQDATGRPDYGEFVQREIARLGPDHPIILTQYLLLPVTGLLNFFSPADLERLQGEHPRRQKPQAGKVYVGAVDFCGADETPTPEDSRALFDPDRSKLRDATCILIGELSWVKQRNDNGEDERVPSIEVVDCCFWVGMLPETLVNRLEEYLFGRWRCQLVCLDGNGVGDGPSTSLSARRPGQVEVVHSTLPTASQMGFRLMGAGKSGRFRLWHAPEHDPELEELRKQFRHLRRHVLPSRQMTWGAPTTHVRHNGVRQPIHDDGPKAGGLLVEAGYRFHLTRRRPPEHRDYEPWDEAAGYAEAA